MHTGLEWQARSTEAGVVLRVIGEVDLATIDEMRDALRDQVVDRTTLIADFAGVAFISVAGVRLLLRTDRTLHERDGRFIIWRPHRAVERVIDLIGDHSLDIHHGPLAAIGPVLTEDASCSEADRS